MKNFNYGGSIKPPTFLQKIKIRIELWFKNCLYRLGIKKTKILTNEEILGKPYVVQKAKITGVIKGENNDGSLIIEHTDQEINNFKEIIAYLKKK